MTHGSLFSGIGGFDLAAEWMGWNNLFHCELELWRRKLLKHKFPGSISHSDISKTDFKIYRNAIDILTGGDPCQPHSIAGKREGKEDNRYLWPEYRRCYNECLPGWIVNENVEGSISNGILDQKISDLEADGYTCWPPLVIPAGSITIHKRNRVWLVAHSNTERWRKQHIPEKPAEQEKRDVWNGDFSPNALGHTGWDESKSAILGMFDGLSQGLDYPDRCKRIDSLGNAIYPQLAYQIFQAIEQYEFNKY